MSETRRDSEINPEDLVNQAVFLLGDSQHTVPGGAFEKRWKEIPWRKVLLSLIPGIPFPDSEEYFVEKPMYPEAKVLRSYTPERTIEVKELMWHSLRRGFSKELDLHDMGALRRIAVAGYIPATLEEGVVTAVSGAKEELYSVSSSLYHPWYGTWHFNGQVAFTSTEGVVNVNTEHPYKIEQPLAWAADMLAQVQAEN